MNRITVLTPSIPERGKLLAECVVSVQKQTVPVFAHLIRIDARLHEKPQSISEHIAEQLNALLKACDTEWVMILADDDLLMPHHVETLLPHLNNDNDVVYSWAEGPLPQINCNHWDRARFLMEIERANWISSSGAIVRRSVLRKVCGWSEIGFNHAKRRYPSGADWEDWDLWIRIARATPTRFHCVPKETWYYRRGPWEHAIAQV